MAAHPSEDPQQSASEREKMAFAFTELAQGRKPAYALKKQQEEHIQALLKALKSGQKAKVYELSQCFYHELLKPEDITSAYFQVVDMNLTENPNFRIIMDWIKDKYGRQRPQGLIQRPLDEVVVLLLLAVTHTPNSSISYKRVMNIRGEEKECPTSYPLNETVIRDFLLPFGSMSNVLSQAVIFHRQTVLGNPGGVLGHKHAQKRKQWLQEQEALTQTEHPIPEVIEPISKRKKESLQALSHSTDQLYEFCTNTLETEAVRNTLTEANLRRLALLTHAPANLFLNRLCEIYSQTLSPERAQALAERMVQAFQALMQQLNHRAGKDWFKLWLSVQTFRGKQTQQVVEVTESEDTITRMLQQDAIRQDKLAGAKALTEFQTQFESEETPLTIKELPTLSSVLQSLSQKAHIQSLLQLSLPGPLQDQFSQELLSLLELAFAHSGYSMSAVKNSFLQSVNQQHQELARQVIAHIELACNRLAEIYSQHIKLDFVQALEIFELQAREASERAKLSSARFRNSAAGHYHRYSGSAF
jgi:hypothetical protein